MPKKDLTGKKIAILATEGFEQVELLKPRAALEKVGATTQVVAPTGNVENVEDVENAEAAADSVTQIRAWNMRRGGKYVTVDVPLESANPNDFDALLLPGGVMNADKLRMIPKAVEFVRHFVDAGKPIASICHGPWMLVEANAVRGRTLTSYPSIKTDITNAGGNWIDQEVVTDQGLVTSRKPDDIRAFNKKMIEEFAKGVHREERRIA